MNDVSGKMVYGSNASEGAGADHSPGCFSITSDFSAVASPERAPDATQLINLVAVLPILPIPEMSSVLAHAWDVADDAALNKNGLYRDHCVYLI